MVIANEARSAELAIIISYPTRARGTILNPFLPKGLPIDEQNRLALDRVKSTKEPIGQKRVSYNPVIKLPHTNLNMNVMLYEVRCLKSNEDMILALAGQFKQLSHEPEKFR